MIYKNGLIKVPHFAHKDKRECDYGFWENETKEHHLGKVHLFNWLKQLPDIKNLKLEAWISETKQRPDLMFNLLGDTYVIEYQCSNITLKEYLEREKLYELMNVKSIWILGTENFYRKRKKTLEKFLFEKNKISYYFDSIGNNFLKIKDAILSERYKLYNPEYTGSLEDFYLNTDNQIKSHQEVFDDFMGLHNKVIHHVNTRKQKEFNDLLKNHNELYLKLLTEHVNIPSAVSKNNESNKVESVYQIRNKKKEMPKCNKCEYNRSGFCDNYSKWCSFIRSDGWHKSYFSNYHMEIHKKCRIWRWLEDEKH